MLRGKWWEIYNDPQLNQLEEQVTPQNQSLRAALETYLAARDQVSIARADFYPTLSAGPNISRDRVSANRPLAVAGNYYQLQRFSTRRPSQLGAGLLGPHPSYRRGCS